MWLIDAAVAVAAIAIGLSILYLAYIDPNDGGQAPLAVELTAGVVAATALVLFRRRWPTALALCLIPLGILFATPMGATMMALFGLAVRRSWRVTVAVATLHATAVVTMYRLAITDDGAYVSTVVALLLLHEALVATGMLVRSQRALVRSLEERARQAEEGQRLRVEEARHTERERLAREMHDVLAHRMSLLAVHAGALEVRRDASAQERQAAGVIRHSAYEALEDLRQVIGMLREPDRAGAADRPLPTLADLPELVEQSRLAGTPVTLDSRVTDAAAMPAGVGLHVYRIVQEALTNARKHAPGRPVRVTVRCPAPDDPGAVTVEVANPLPAGPAAPIPGAGAGLIGLGERLSLVGGRLVHGPTGDGDFRLHASLPWRREGGQ